MSLSNQRKYERVKEELILVNEDDQVIGIGEKSDSFDRSTTSGILRIHL